MTHFWHSRLFGEFFQERPRIIIRVRLKYTVYGHFNAPAVNSYACGNCFDVVLYKMIEV